VEKGDCRHLRRRRQLLRFRSLGRFPRRRRCLQKAQLYFSVRHREDDLARRLHNPQGHFDG
jgi:hypothetical protein